MENDIEKEAVLKIVLSKLGITDVPCQVTSNLKDKITELSYEEKYRLLNSIDKDTVLKLQKTIDNIQGDLHG